MKNLDLNAIGVVEMDALEIIRTDGGSKGGGFWVAVADAIIDYFNGLSDGYNDFKKNN